MKTFLVAQILGLLSLAWCGQPGALKPIPAPLRDLKFGAINFLHTTDTHGWHGGHKQEASYGADWGDYVDFASRLREKIEAEGNDLLVVDSGDRVEGNGLYDASDPKGKYTYPIFTHQRMDVICTGNHELYKQNASENDYNFLVPAYPKAYLSSNLDIKDPKTGKFVPMGKRYNKFTTHKRGIRIVAFGFIFDFDRNFNNTRVTSVEDTVKKQWFQKAIHDRAVDLFVVVGHIPAHGTEFDVIYQAIRAVHPDTPIQFFGGHYHIRDYKKFQHNAYALASGRFLETIGFQSIDGIKGRHSRHYAKSKATKSSPTFFRRYIDNNLYSFYHHSKTNASTFHSSFGRKVSAQISAARKELGLDKTYGCAPIDLWMNRVPFPASNSIFSWLNGSVFPATVIEDARKDKHRFVLTNTGAIRFDIFKGPFTVDTESMISPFTSGMHYIKDVPLAQASKLTALLNSFRKILSEDETSILDTGKLAPLEQWSRPSDSPPVPQNYPDVNDNQIALLFNDGDLKITPGYVTKDDLGTDGDDTIHDPVPQWNLPNVVQSYTPSTSVSDVADVVFNEFMDPFVLAGMKALGIEYKKSDIKVYLPGNSMTDLITKWVKDNWKQDCESEVQLEL